MDRVERQREIIYCLLKEYRALYADADNSEVETLIVRDDDNGQYQLMRVGWRGEKRLRRPVFYVRLKDGKIWIEEDWTQESIANELLAAGIPNEDIVLAFNPPEVRHLTEFAVS